MRDLIFFVLLFNIFCQTLSFSCAGQIFSQSRENEKRRKERERKKERRKKERERRKKKERRKEREKEERKSIRHTPYSYMQE